MNDWWHSLSAASQAFHLIAAVGTTALLIQALLLAIGIGFDDLSLGDADHGGPADHASGLQLLSVRTITAFLAGFGWGGVVAIGAGVPLAVLAALAGGCGLTAVVVWLMRSMRRLSHDGTVDYANAVGQVATVYVTIPPGATSGGKVEVLVQGRLATVDAIGQGAAAIATGSKVRVLATADRTTLVVAPL